LKKYHFNLVVSPNCKKVIDSINSNENLPFYSSFNSKEKLFEVDATSWKSIDKDMKLISNSYPNILFQVDLRDSNTDIRFYYKNGKKQVANVCKLFEKFDEKKLLDF